MLHGCDQNLLQRTNNPKKLKNPNHPNVQSNKSRSSSSNKHNTNLEQKLTRNRAHVNKSLETPKTISLAQCVFLLLYPTLAKINPKWSKKSGHRKVDYWLGALLLVWQVVKYPVQAGSIHTNGLANGLRQMHLLFSPFHGNFKQIQHFLNVSNTIWDCVRSWHT